MRSAAIALVVCTRMLIGVQAAAQPNAPPPNLTIAFIGDQGTLTGAQAVLGLVVDEGADAVIHSGDLGYTSTPSLWEGLIDENLGSDFPYFACVGNHDVDNWYGPNGYQELLSARMNRLGVEWQGDLGVQSSFLWNGIFIVFTAPGVFGAGDGFHDLYVRDQLDADPSLWRISSWHKNMKLMQVGGKNDTTGWGVYEQSRRGGAIIATAHEHSYSRTHLMSSLEFQTVASTDETLALVEDDPDTPADEGRSFVFVSGLGGRSIRDQHHDGAWWASIYTSTQDANHGALFGVFHYQGNPNLARFYFKNIDGYVVDEFFVRSARATGVPVPLLDLETSALLGALLFGTGLALLRRKHAARTR